MGLTLGSVGCLRTRSQLKDSDSDSKPLPTKVQPVNLNDGHTIDEIKLEITRMNGRLDDLERAHQVGGSKFLNQEEAKKLELRISELEKTQAIMIESIKKTQDSLMSVNETENFSKAKSQFESKNYNEAIEGFSKVMRNPKGARFEEATFLRAESYFHSKQFNKAIVDYSVFTEKDPPSKYLLKSLYRIGLSLEGVGMKKEAKDFFQDLVERFPKSAEAKEVKAKLKIEGKKTKPKKSKKSE